MGRANLAAWFLLWGIVLFSGSLYFMVLTGSNALALVTPLGGLSLLAGWAVLACPHSNEGFKRAAETANLPRPMSPPNKPTASLMPPRTILV